MEDLLAVCVYSCNIETVMSVLNGSSSNVLHMFSGQSVTTKTRNIFNELNDLLC